MLAFKQKLMALFVTIALVAGLLPSGAALASDTLTMGLLPEIGTQAQNGFVADRVYAMVGNDYAVMVTESDTAHTIDVIDSNYNKTLEFTDEYAKDESGLNEFVRTTSEFGYLGMLTKGVRVTQSRQVGEGSRVYQGFRSYDGTSVRIPCEYDSLTESPDGNYLAGIAITNGAAQLSMLSTTAGATVATADLGTCINAYASFERDGSGVSVNRSWEDAQGLYRYETLQYAFDGSALTPGAASTSQGIQLQEGEELCGQAFIQRKVYDEAGEYITGYEYYSLDRQKIASLSGYQYWSYDHRADVQARSYLFTSFKDISKAILVDATGAVKATFVSPRMAEHLDSISSYSFSWNLDGNRVWVEAQFDVDGDEGEADSVSYDIVDYFDRNGNLLPALADWAYLDYFTQSGSAVEKAVLAKNGIAKVIDASNAQLCSFELPAGFAIRDTSESVGSPWGVVGDYLYFTGSSTTMVYSISDGAAALSLPKDQSLWKAPVGCYYVTSEAAVPGDYGGTRYGRLIVKYLDLNLKETVSGKPPIGNLALTMPDGTKLYETGYDEFGYVNLGYGSVGYVDADPSVLRADGQPYQLAGYTVTVPQRGTRYPLSKCDESLDRSGNAFFVMSSEKKYGMVDKTGREIIPVVYDDIFAGAAKSTKLPQSDYLMVKSNGAWSFVEKGGGSVPQPSVPSTPGLEVPPSPDNPAAGSGTGAGTRSISSAAVTGIVNKTYNGKEQTQAITVLLDGEPLVNGVDYQVSYSDNVNAGMARMVVTGAGSYTGELLRQFAIGKAANPMKAKAVTKSVKLKGKSKKVSGVVKLTKNAKGSVRYTKVAVGSSRFLRLTSSKSPKLIVQGNPPKDTYKIRIKVHAAGTVNYKGKSQVVTVKVKVK